MAKRKKLSVLAKEVDYGDSYKHYIPSTEAIEYIEIVKQIYGDSLENKTPIAHYMMFDELYAKIYSCIVAARGMAKSTFVQNLFFYVAIMGKLPTVGKVKFMIYVSDTVENGVRTMTEAMRFTHENSEFLKKYIPDCKFNDTRWVLTNLDDESLVVRCYGAEAGIRGAREQNERPSVAIIDDVLNDKNAVSPAKLRNIRNTVFKAIDFALHPTRKKMILIGTPFHDRCIVSQAVKSGNFSNLILPICEKFPCEPEEFRGAWEDRFPYEAIKDMYSNAEKNSELMENEKEEDEIEEEGGLTIEGFMQEMMLQVDGDKLRVLNYDKDFVEYSLTDLMANKVAYNFYITTDFATKDKEQGDLSFILIWAYDDNHNLYIVDGMCGHNIMTENIDQLFEFVKKYRPLEVGVETSGPQSGFISWLDREMIQRDIFFKIKEVPSTTNKLVRFMVVVPKIQAGKFYRAKENKGYIWEEELKEEIDGVTKKGFTSEYDDGCDCVSQIQYIELARPYYETVLGDTQEEIDLVVQNSKRTQVYELNHNLDNIKRYKNSYTI